MSDVASAKRAGAGKTMLWIGVAAVLLFVFGANAHLVYVAVRSEPSCVAHVKQGDNVRGLGNFSAAQSAWSFSDRATPSLK